MVVRRHAQPNGSLAHDWPLTPGDEATSLACPSARTKPRAHGEREIPLRPLPWWIVLLAVTLVVIVTWAVTGWLLRIAAGDPTRQIEAIKTGLTAGAGTGGAVALLLAVRRQWSAEVSTVHTTHDAAERRLTELYTKAADQLGSDKAPVRFAGLYALERLADANPQQRQTIVNLLCAYLRMPYQPADNSLLTSKGKPAELELRYDKYRKQREEGEVRNAAQRIVTRHLNPRNDDYWVALTERLISTWKVRTFGALT